MISKFLNLPRQINVLRNYIYGSKVYGYIDKYKTIELPGKFKGTFIEKWLSYWRDVFRDYVDVAKDAGKEIYNKPWKGVALVSGATSCAYLVCTNPDESSFRDRLISCSNELIFVGPPIRNPECVNHLKFLEQCYNEGTIRRFSFGLFSVIWVDNYNKYVGIYKALCPYLKPDYLKIDERIIDVGFCNKWWTIEKKMVDMDVNPNEWKDNIQRET